MVLLKQHLLNNIFYRKKLFKGKIRIKGCFKHVKSIKYLVVNVHLLFSTISVDFCNSTVCHIK